MVDSRDILRRLFIVCFILFIIGFEISPAEGGSKYRGSRSRVIRSSGSRSSGSRSSGSRYSESRYTESRNTGSRNTGSRSSGTTYTGSRNSGSQYGGSSYARNVMKNGGRSVLNSGSQSRGTRYDRTRYTGSGSYSDNSYRRHIVSHSYQTTTRFSDVEWKAALLSSYYYGSRRYLTRRRYYSGTRPRICENFENLRENDIFPWGKFVCPLGELPDDYVYCCGETAKQTCCRFFDDAGRTAGVVVGVLLFFGLIGLVVFCCCRCQMKNKKKVKNDRSTVSKNSITSEPRDVTVAVNYIVTEYSPAGMAPEYQADPDSSVMPPSYEEVDNSPNPAAAAEGSAPPYSHQPIDFTLASGQSDPPPGYDSSAGKGYTG